MRYANRTCSKVLEGYDVCDSVSSLMTIVEVTTWCKIPIKTGTRVSSRFQTLGALLYRDESKHFAATWRKSVKQLHKECRK